MARDLNKHQCIGRVGQDPEITYLPSGSAVAKLSVACSLSWMDKNTGQKQERTEWIRYVAFNKLAEIIGEYVKKGQQVYLSGELRTNKWQKDGIDMYTTEIVADTMQMLGSRQDGQAGNAQARPQQAPAQQLTQPQAQNFDNFDDDIPFNQPVSS